MQFGSHSDGAGRRNFTYFLRGSDHVSTAGKKKNFKNFHDPAEKSKKFSNR